MKKPTQAKKRAAKRAKPSKDKQKETRSRPTGSRSRFEGGDSIGGGDARAEERAVRDSPGRDAPLDAGDDGELRAVHTPTASDRNIPDEDRAMNGGETWLEALEQRAAEGGPLPEHEIDLEDDETNGRRDR